MNRKLESIKKKNAENVEKTLKMSEDFRTQLSDNLGKMIHEEQRVASVSLDAHIIIKDVERDFRRATKLTDVDIAFLFLAAALQCVRQYVLKPLMDTKRVSDHEAAKNSGKGEEHSDRKHRYYNPSLQEIITNPVPFDANIGAEGALSGGGKLGHRSTTLGHDPILGLVFGTANIATSTLTNWRFQSWHIATREGRDVFAQKAKTKLVLRNTVDKLLHQGTEGKTIVGSSIVKEIIHLRSDINSTRSLPLPFISAIDPKLASELADWGLDMAGVKDAGKQFALAMTIDLLIAFIHGMFYQGSDNMSRSLYQVRTRRVLLYSNLIATTSNVVVSAISAYVGGEEAAKKVIDLGGYLNTLRHLVFDIKFINEVKQEFLKKELYDMITGPQYDFMEGK